MPENVKRSFLRLSSDGTLLPPCHWRRGAFVVEKKTPGLDDSAAERSAKLLRTSDWRSTPLRLLNQVLAAVSVLRLNS